MMGLRRSLAYIIIVLIVGLVFWLVFMKITSQPSVLDNTKQLQELGLTEAGNEFITIERPTYRQFVSSPLAVKVKLYNTSGVNVYLTDAAENEVARQSIEIRPDNLTYVVNLQFTAPGGEGYVVIKPFEADKAGVRLPIRFGN